MTHDDEDLTSAESIAGAMQIFFAGAVSVWLLVGAFGLFVVYQGQHQAAATATDQPATDPSKAVGAPPPP
ncbi:hypothetical protein [uncultured Devosia sp.]|uniref:hypothetical protein n=1 Tax=uncultured Devosia sp. TaxID=211434 RepID=UPI0035CC4765